MTTRSYPEVWSDWVLIEGRVEEKRGKKATPHDIIHGRSYHSPLKTG